MTNDRPRVIFLQPPMTDDVEEAAAIHGNVQSLFDDDDENLPPPLQTSSFMRQVTVRLEDIKFRPDWDIIVYSGRFNYMGLFVIAVTKAFGNFRMLMWNPKYANYTMKDIVGRT